MRAAPPSQARSPGCASGCGPTRVRASTRAIRLHFKPLAPPRGLAVSGAGGERCGRRRRAPLIVPRLRLTLAGIAEDPAPDGGGSVRTAIITGNGQLFLAKEGDTVADRGVEYRVGNISADSAELIDLRDNTTRRLTLK